MELKHKWEPYDAQVLTAFKEFCRNRKRCFSLSLSEMLKMQRGMAKVLKDRSMPCEFFSLWNFFGASGSSQARSSEKHLIWRNVFIQTAAAVLAHCPVLEERAEENIHTLANDILKGSYFHFHYAPLESKIYLRDQTILKAAESGDAAKVKLIYDLSRNPETKLKYTFLFLLNKRSYETLMDVYKLCGGLEILGKEILEEHFFYYVPGEGKKRFNDFFMEKYPHAGIGNFWNRHRSARNLQAILIPALEKGFSPQENLFPGESALYFSLHRFLMFMDELSQELLMPVYREMSEMFQYDIKCAELYFQWLDQQKKDPQYAD